MPAASFFTMRHPSVLHACKLDSLALTTRFSVAAFSTVKPSAKPSDPRFGSGPCKKRPGYDLKSVLQSAALGRSHRSKLGKAKLKESIELTKQVLQLPKDYLVGIVPGSDTGAFEMALWHMLGRVPVDCFYWESFGKGWASDITTHLNLKSMTKVYSADYGKLPNLSEAKADHDIVFTFNGTTSGVRVPKSNVCNFLSSSRTGLTFCDATSAAFAMELPWSKLDVTTFSWQKVLGGEGAHGMLVLSPRAVERLESFVPENRPLPKVFRLTKGGKLEKDIFEGSTINTPSMLCVEDYLDALKWAESIGGLKTLLSISDKNLNILETFVKQNSEWLGFLAKDSDIRSNTSICLEIKDLNGEQVKEVVKVLEKENVAVDIGSYRDAPPGLRIWGGATVENKDMEILTHWIKYAHDVVKTAK